MKALSFFEMSAAIFQSKRSYIPEKLNLQESGNGKLKSHKHWVTENKTFFFDQMNACQYLQKEFSYIS
jgi:hypothetical protein